MTQIVLGMTSTVEAHGINIEILFAVIGCVDNKTIAVLEVKSSLFEQRSSHHIFVRSRANRVETQRREHIPGRSLSVVFVSAVTVRSGRVHSVHYLTQPILSLPRLSRIVIEVDHVLDRLIAMCIVAHIHHCHFTNFVNHLSVIAVIKNGRYGKYRIHHGNKHLFPAHQVNKSLRIVEDRPGIMPAVSFCKGISPFQR